MHIIINVLTVNALTILKKHYGGAVLVKDFDKERAHETFRKMIQTDRLHRCVMEKFLSSFGIHRSQHMTLMFLSHHGECTSQKQIAEHFKISSASVAVTLKKLEDGGYIERESAEDDSRYNSIKITKKGKEIIDKSEEIFSNADYEMFKDFSDEDYVIFSSCLDRMAKGLTEYAESFSDSSDGKQ